MDKELIRCYQCELPPNELGGFLAHRPDSIPSPPRAEPRVWQEGYGGHGLLKLSRFGLSHPYRSEDIQIDIKRLPIHPTTKVMGFLGTDRKDPAPLLLVKLMNTRGEAKAPAWKAYSEAKAQAEKALEEAKAQAEKAYEEAWTLARKMLNEADAQAEKVFDESWAPFVWAGKEPNDATAQAQAQVVKVYKEARAQAKKVFDEAIAPTGKALHEARAQAKKAEEETMTQAREGLGMIGEESFTAVVSMGNRITVPFAISRLMKLKQGDFVRVTVKKEAK